MNVENILKVATEIETRLDLDFDIHSHATCIIGWSSRTFNDPYIIVSHDITKLFDIDHRRIVYDRTPHYTRMYTPNREQAVKCLRHLAETGEVDWKLAMFGERSI